MGFRLLIFFLNVIILLCVFAIYEQQTAQSLCISTGQAIRNMAIDNSGNEGLSGFGRWVFNFGQSIDDTCSRRTV